MLDGLSPKEYDNSSRVKEYIFRKDKRFFSRISVNKREIQTGLEVMRVKNEAGNLARDFFLPGMGHAIPQGNLGHLLTIRRQKR